MSMVWETPLSTSEKMVLLVISDHADDEGRNSWPSVSTIARKASISERQAKRIIRQLESAGLLSIELQAGGSRDMRDDRRPNRYTISINGVSRMTSRNDSRGDIDTPRGDIQDMNGVSPMSPKPSLEPSLKEPSNLMIISDDRFIEFWDVYPRKAGKVNAKKAFAKATESTTADIIIKAAAAYRDDPHRLPEFTAHPATWLNRGGWEDEPLPARKKSATEMYVDTAFDLANDLIKLEAGRDAI